MQLPKDTLHNIAPPALQWIKVIPNSPKDEFAGIMADGTWKIRIAEKALRGKANRRLITFLEHAFSRRVEIVRGRASSKKLIKIL